MPPDGVPNDSCSCKIAELRVFHLCRRYVWAFQFCVMVGLPLTLAMGKVGDAPQHSVHPPYQTQHTLAHAAY